MFNVKFNFKIKGDSEKGEFKSKKWVVVVYYVNWVLKGVEVE